MNMLQIVRNSALGVVFALAATLVAVWFFFSEHWSAFPDIPRTVSTESHLKKLLPDADPLLLQRSAQKLGDVAVSAAVCIGEDGLRVLEAFGDEAAYCLTHDQASFKSLARVVRLDPVRFRLASGPWNRAVLDWAQNGKLDRFIDRLDAMAPEQVDVAEACPDSLPLLCAGNSGIVADMLKKYDERAWRLFMAVNFTEYPEDLERVAAALDREGERMLCLNEDYGLPFALLLVPSRTDRGSQHIPEVVKFALRTLDDEPSALALMIINYDSIKEMLDSGIALRQIEEAIEQFAALPPVVREFAFDHANTLRLLTETWHGEKLGSAVLRRCGPAAADLIYSRYANDDRLKLPALVAMARLGEPAFQVFHRFRDYGRFYTLLKRFEPDLMNPRENPPAVVHAIHNIVREGQEKLDIYADVGNLKGQVLADVRGPLPEEAILEWVPGYVAYRTAVNYTDGRHVTGGDIFWATVDGVSTATIIYGPIANGLKRSGSKVVQEGAKLAAKKGITQAERAAAQKVVSSAEQKLAESMQKLAIESVKREGADVARFGEKAGEIATHRLEARGSGIATMVADRREAYVKLAKAGDISGKARLVEEIGVEGAQKYAAAVGYEPLHSGPPRQGMGFDLTPFRDGNRIVVMEAKGGSSPVKIYHGCEQGTVEYATEVAKWNLRSCVTSAEEKKAAAEVLKAADEGRLFVEVVRTEHTQGKPGLTRVESVFGPKGVVPAARPDGLSAALLQTPGMSRAWVEHAGGMSRRLDTSSWIKQGEGMARRAGISIWTQNAGPLAPRPVMRKGVQSLISPSEPSSKGQVNHLAIALMERGM